MATTLSSCGPRSSGALERRVLAETTWASRRTAHGLSRARGIAPVRSAAPARRVVGHRVDSGGQRRRDQRTSHEPAHGLPTCSAAKDIRRSRSGRATRASSRSTRPHWKVTGDLTIHGVARIGRPGHTLSRRGQSPVQQKDRRGVPGGDGDRSPATFGVTWNAAMDTGGAYLGERVQISSRSWLFARTDRL